MCGKFCVSIKQRWDHRGSCFSTWLWQEYFRDHMEFNHAKDDNICKTGFLAQHHLVRYHTKELELTKIKEELENGSIEAAPHNAMLTNLWEKLTELRKIQLLEKARCFIDVFIESVHKHNKQFKSPELLFLASFGKFKTSIGSKVDEWNELCSRDWDNIWVQNVW